MRPGYWLLLPLALLCALVLTWFQQLRQSPAPVFSRPRQAAVRQSSPAGSWRMTGAEPGNSRQSPVAVGRPLKLLWRQKVVEHAPDDRLFFREPVVAADGAVFLAYDRLNNMQDTVFMALDATGAVLWRKRRAGVQADSPGLWDDGTIACAQWQRQTLWNVVKQRKRGRGSFRSAPSHSGPLEPSELRTLDQSGALVSGCKLKVDLSGPSAVAFDPLGNCWLWAGLNLHRIDRQGAYQTSEQLKGGFTCRRPVFDQQGNVYVCSYPGLVVKLDQQGQVVWQTALGSNSSNEITHNELSITQGGLLYATSVNPDKQPSECRLHCFDLSGQELWASEPLEWWVKLTTAADGTAYVTTRQRLVAFSSRGEKLWETPYAYGEASALTADGLLLSTTSASELLVHDSASGAELQRIALGEGLLTDPVVRDDGVVLVLTAEGNCLAFGRDSVPSKPGISSGLLRNAGNQADFGGLQLH